MKLRPINIDGPMSMSDTPRLALTPLKPLGWGPVPASAHAYLYSPENLSLHHHLHTVDIHLNPLCSSPAAHGAEVLIVHPYCKCQCPRAG